MKYLAFAADYDGTLAIDGRIRPDLVDALIKLRDSGRKLILVTGREKEDLDHCFPQYKLFNRVVLENGALLYRPLSEELLFLTHPAPQNLIELLRRKNIQPFSVGRCILATNLHHLNTATQCIKKLELNYSVTLNKESVMILPTGINKGTGLASALKELDIVQNQTVGIGDAGNDADLLLACGRSYAVADATPELKAIAQYITEGKAHQGPLEVIRFLLEQDLF